MVYRDLFTSDSVPSRTNTFQPPMAFMSDRFLALVLDFLIFSPVMSLLGAGLIKQMKTLLLLNSGSSEAMMLWILMAGFMFFMISAMQALFLYFWQATPGQMFLQLRVISYPVYRQRLTIGQCWQRGFFWTISLICLFPFAEILSHPLRRAFFDRASDTMVITLKEAHDAGPAPLESRFISSWMRLFFLLFLFVSTLAFFQSYPAWRSSIAQDTASARGYICDDVRLQHLRGDERLDTTLALYVLSAVTPDCLDKEADARLWTDPTSDRELAYLAKGLATEDKSILKKYQDQLCREDNEVCRLSDGLLGEGKSVSLNQTRLMTSKIVALEQLIQDKNFRLALNEVKALKLKDSLAEALEKKYVRIMWSVMNDTTKSGGRSPASADTQKLIEEFKESYELP